MSTNYYARIIPPKIKREMLKQLIDIGDFEQIVKETESLYMTFSVDSSTGETKGGVIHLGKRSSGWKFLWNPNMYIIKHWHKEEEISDTGGRIVSKFVDDPNTVYQLYPLTQAGIKDFINREDVVIIDEYGDKQDKEKFWNMALEWEQEDGWDDASYDKHEKKRHSDYNPWVMTGDLVDYLKEHGYKFTNRTNADFYSDGLRFATFTEFS